MKKLLILFIILFFSSVSYSQDKKYAYFAGGCFWCMEAAFEKIDGVTDVVSGYSGGTKANPTYEEVLKGRTGHIETVKITYDPKIISYLELLKNFWINIDPYDGKGQFCDKGNSYTSVIFYQNNEENKLIDQSINEMKSLNRKKIKTAFVEFKNFYPAEDYHQNYYKENPTRYYSYLLGCGRPARLKEIWK
jgi:methionine-S-sulfoxide reductase